MKSYLIKKYSMLQSYRDTIDRLATVFGRILLFLIFFTLLFLSWRKWPDILVDFGRELYIPWQVSSGKILYKDIAHLFGPLSIYFHAFLFLMFGVTYSVIIGSNIIILSTLVILIYLYTYRASSPLAAFLSAFAVLLIFSFSQYLIIGNYNFLSPYSHEATHGMLLATTLIWMMNKYLLGGRFHHIMIAGFLFGCVFLTKIDIVVAIFTVAVVGIFLRWMHVKCSASLFKDIVVFIVASIIPQIAIFLYHSFFIGFDEASDIMNRIWGTFITTGIASNPFYKSGMGLDNIKANLLRMLIHFAVFSASYAALLLLCRIIKSDKLKDLRTILSAIGIFAIITSVRYIDIYTLGSALPLLTMVFIIYLIYDIYTNGISNASKFGKVYPLLLWSVFSFVLLWKIVFAAKFYHYGFYLALPATVLMICFVVDYLPNRYAPGYSRSFVRISIAIVIIIISLVFFQKSNMIYKFKHFPVGEGADKIFSFPSHINNRGIITDQAYRWLKSNLKADETLVVLPEGVMLNYLTKRQNPTPYINFMVPEILRYGEENILEALSKAMPDYIAIAHKNTSEYGYQFFGQDPAYGKMIMDWVYHNYKQLLIFGDVPLKDHKFGIEVLKRNNA